jgi:antitoxin component of RelBE/YafQ-DinJ toxin-antitoxin module
MEPINYSSEFPIRLDNSVMRRIMQICDLTKIDIDEYINIVLKSHVDDMQETIEKINQFPPTK